MTITPRQSRAARALLGWTQPDLARAANVGHSTVADFERGKSHPIPNNMEATCLPKRRPASRREVRTALETAGITFIPENGGGLGVRLRERG